MKTRNMLCIYIYSLIVAFSLIVPVIYVSIAYEPPSIPNERPHIHNSTPQKDPSIKAPKVIEREFNTLTFQFSIISNLTEHTILAITCNENFSDYGLLGSGTEDDPYIISDINFSDSDIGIYITNVSAYFTIKENYFKNLSIGIYIENLSAPCFIITDNYFQDILTAGIWIDYAKSFVLLNNQFSFCSSSIFMNNTYDAEIGNNAFLNSQNFGLWFNNVENINVTNNVIKFSKTSGIIFTNSTKLFLLNNSVIENNNYGIYTNSCSNITFNSSVILDNDISFRNYADLGLFATVNVKIIKLVTNQTTYGMYIYDSVDITIEDAEMNFHKNYAIDINNSTRIMFSKLNFSSNNNDIKIYKTVKCVIQHFSSEGNEKKVFRIENSQDIEFFDLNISGKPSIVYLILETESIYIAGLVTYGDNVILGSNLYNISLIDITTSFAGTTAFNIDNSEVITITNNSITNDFFGIMLVNCLYVKIMHNIIKNTNAPGIWLRGTNNTLVHHNDLIGCNFMKYEWNGIEIKTQAFDHLGENNTWYDAQRHIGNFWSDWNGKGVYRIEGSTGSVDLYPSKQGINGSWTLEHKSSAPSIGTLVVAIIFSSLIVKCRIRKRKKQDR
ncbi:MAG: right-handed parallel beta-helix repeat-containing protein [Candidatus Heimdallarchaeaceae archaeon]